MRVPGTEIGGKKKSTASNDIFDKCRQFTRPGDLQAAGSAAGGGDRALLAPGEDLAQGQRQLIGVLPHGGEWLERPLQ